MFGELDKEDVVKYEKYVGTDIVGRTITAIHEGSSFPRAGDSEDRILSRANEAILCFADGTWTFLKGGQHSWGEPGIFVPSKRQLCHVGGQWLVDIGIVTQEELGAAIEEDRQISNQGNSTLLLRRK